MIGTRFTTGAVIPARSESTGEVAMRVALLSYRSKPHCGGQGVYVRHLSRELVRLGHEVEVFSGQPYPELDEGVRLTKVPSLDLYREPDPFRVPRLREFRDPSTSQEFLIMCTAGFPEPRTFARRVARLLRGPPWRLRRRARQPGARPRHPRDRARPRRPRRDHDPPPDHPRPAHRPRGGARAGKRRLTLRRWYGFLRMQVAVARRARHVLTPSESSKRDVVRDFGIARRADRGDPAGRRRRASRRRRRPRVPGRLLAMASADAPLKGIATLLRPSPSCASSVRRRALSRRPSRRPAAAPSSWSRSLGDRATTCTSCTASPTRSWSS